MKQLSWRWRLGLMAGLALLVYLPAIRGGFVWDDDAYVTSNTALRSLRGLWEIWFQPGKLDQYYPLTYSSFWIDYHLWGLRPIGYHIVNVLLHALNALLVWKLLERLKIRGAWFASLLFLLHPVMVESVAWITERKNLLSGLFCLSSLLAYLRFKKDASRLWPWYVTSFCLFVLALLGKTVTGTLPLVILLILGWKEERFPGKDILRLIPFFAVAAVLSAITLRLESGHILNTGTGEWTFSFAERCLIAGRALWFYLGKLAWPHPLIFIYPRWTITTASLGQWCFPAAYMLLLIMLWSFRKRWGRGPFTAFAIFGVVLLPALGFRSFFPMRFSFVADHFQYLATIAPFALATSAMAGLIKQQKVRIVLGIAVLMLLGGLSWKQCGAYKDLESLWRDTLSKNPDAWLAHNNLGSILEQSGRAEDAEFHFSEAVRLKPDYGLAFNNWGFLKEKQGAPEKALEYYRKAVALEPQTAEFHFYLGSCLHGLERIEEAIPHYQKAAELLPTFSAPCYNLGSIFASRGEAENAVRWYRETLRRNPRFIDAYLALGDLLSKTDKRDEALIVYEEALKTDPGNTRIREHLAKALSLQPSSSGRN
ncbi:MAG: tetratricopeptide repeat protein [Candidatus Omnitrophota bacterium]